MAEAKQDRSKKKSREIAEKSKAPATNANAVRKLDKYIPAMLAQETDKAFSHPDWLYEIKWDGYRAIAELGSGEIQLYSRNGNSFTDDYPSILAELENWQVDAVLDGEIVVLNEDGNPEFQKLQHYEQNAQFQLVYYVFDLLILDGNELYALPLIQRKELLKDIFVQGDVVKYSDHVLQHGEDFFAAAIERDLEGVMAKKTDSHYYPGKRTNEWLKLKHHKSDEAIICGFTEPRGGRKYFGALVLGTMADGRLRYIGHTGSGFNQEGLKQVWQKMQPLITEASPFKEKVKTNSPVTWLEPLLVAEMKFTEITSDGKMRHPIFLRLREDNKTADVTMAAKSKDLEKSKSVRPDEEKSANTLTAKSGSNNIHPKKNGSIITFGKIKFTTTNRDKIFFPDEGITKGDVIDYYLKMGEYILPYLKDRPESLMRTPNGINAKGFFHKDAGSEAPDFVKSIPLYSETAKKTIDYILCNNQATLTYLNNLGCIEINPWHSTIKSLDNPDYMIIDIDPSENNTFDHVIEAALVVKQVLDKAGATGICKTSGATGLHVYVPMGKKYSYEQVKNFAYIICLLVNEQIPEITTLERSLSKRSKSKIYMDYLQNRKGQTIACVYSLRPKKGASVSMPLLWDEVQPGLNPLDFNITSVPVIMKSRGDLFKQIFNKPTKLATCLENLEQK